MDWSQLPSDPSLVRGFRQSANAVVKSASDDLGKAGLQVDAKVMDGHPRIAIAVNAWRPILGCRYLRLGSAGVERPSLCRIQNRCNLQTHHIFLESATDRLFGDTQLSAYLPIMARCCGNFRYYPTSNDEKQRPPHNHGLRRGCNRCDDYRGEQGRSTCVSTKRSANRAHIEANH
jgi:hypothetical protein